MKDEQLINNIIYYSENLYTKEDLKGINTKVLQKMLKKEMKRIGVRTMSSRTELIKIIGKLKHDKNLFMDLERDAYSEEILNDLIGAAEELKRKIKKGAKK